LFLSVYIPPEAVKKAPAGFFLSSAHWYAHDTLMAGLFKEAGLNRALAFPPLPKAARIPLRK
jgi:hypothetical protein